MSGTGSRDLDELIAQTRRRLAEFERIADEARRVDGDEDDDDAQEAFARRARAGDLGRDWAVLQGRIDLGDTTLADIMNGADDSAEAAAVRVTSQTRLAELAAAERERAEREGQPDPAAELDRDRERLLARGAALRARMTDMLKDLPDGGRG